MLLSRQELVAKLIEAVRPFLADDEAEYFAVETYLRKAPRINALEEAMGDIESWRQLEARDFKVERDLPGLLKLDFNGLGPTLKVKALHDELEKRAKANGIAMIALNNSKGMHAMHFWVQGLAKRGLVGLAAINGGPLAVVPLNGTKGLLGTNPFAYALPDGNNNIVIDMATSEIPYFHIRDAVKSGQPLPPHSAVDTAGNETTVATEAIDAEEISNLLPLGGGYKGYALNYLFEVMTGAMIGAKMSDVMDPDYVVEEHGGWLIAIDIASFTDLETYQKSVASLGDAIRSQVPKQGEKVIVPGDTNAEKYEALKDQPIEVSDELLARLEISS